MERRLTEALDDTLASLARGESREACLARYPESALELAALIDAREQLKVLSHMPPLADSEVAVRRGRFLSAARAMAHETESVPPLRRLAGWVLSPGGQQLPGWIPALVRVVVVLLIVVGSLGGTAAMAQASLPDSPLYGLKLAIEDGRLSLTRDPSRQVALNLAFASERTREIRRSVASDREISSKVQRRLQAELDAALWSAASAGDEVAPRLLEQIRLMVHTQEQSLAQAQVHASGDTRVSLRFAQQAMTQARTQAEAALGDPSPPRHRQGQDPPIESAVETTHESDTPALTQEPPATRQPTWTPLATVTSKPAESSQSTAAPDAALTPQPSGLDAGQLSSRTPVAQPRVEASPTNPDAQPTLGQDGPTSQPSPGASDPSVSGGSGDRDSGGGTGAGGPDSDSGGPDSGDGAGSSDSGAGSDSPGSGREGGRP